VFLFKQPEFEKKQEGWN